MGINNVTENVEEKKILELIIESSEYFLQSAGNNLNYQKFTDDILYISGAKYACFDLYNDDGSKFRTLAFSAPSEVIKKISSLLGFKFIGREWLLDPGRAEKIKAHTITHFPTLSELVAQLIPKPVLYILEKTFGSGEVALVKILKDNLMVGDFTIFMPRNTKIKNKIILIYIPDR